jgi:RND superfamily putative drug exporter
LRLAAPAWNEVAHDGDLAYLPAGMKSVRGEALLSSAFPHSRSKSQVVVVAAREGGSLHREDAFVAYDLARRFRAWHGAASLRRTVAWMSDADRLAAAGRAEEAQALRDEIVSEFHAAENALDEAIRFDQTLAKNQEELAAAGANYSPLPSLHFNRAVAMELQGLKEKAQEELRRAVALDPKLAEAPLTAARPDADIPLLDVWTWDHDVLGDRLSRDHARLIVLHLENEFLATDNVRILDRIEAEIDAVREAWAPATAPGLTLGLSGSAAVGGEMLRASAESIRHTELFTVAIIFLILVPSIVRRCWWPRPWRRLPFRFWSP